MEFAVLGPVAARTDGRQLVLGGPKQRAVLAMLLLNANRPLTRDRLIDGLWGEAPPRSAAHTLDDYISRLRRLLGQDRIERRPAGYVLHVEPGELDLDRFEQLLEQGIRAGSVGNAATASGALGEALALWRGRPLADLEYEPFAAPEVRRLEERRLLAVEERIDAELQLGRAAELIGELEQLVAEHPFRERFLGQLMVALYRAGRQAAALEALRAARRRFAGELGIEPGPQLARLERQILEHDPGLDIGHPPSSPRTRRSGWLLASAVAVAAGVIGLIAASLPSSRSAADVGDGKFAGLVRVGTGSAHATPAPLLPGSPGSIAAGEGSLWVADTSDNALLRVDSSTGARSDSIPLGQQPGDIAVGGGSVWVASTAGPFVWRVDTTSDAIVQRIALPAIASTLAFVDRALWVGDPVDDAVLRIDAASGDVVHRTPVGVQPSAIVGGAGKLWVAGYDAGSVLPIDPGSSAAGAPVQVGGRGPVALAFAGGWLWVANRLDGTVSRVDPASGSVRATLPTGSGPIALTVANGSVWVANEFSATLSRIDARHGTLAASIPVGGNPAAVTATSGSHPIVWVATRQRDFHHGGTLVLLDTRRFGSIDPQIENETPPAEFLGLINDGLVAYDHTAGPEGLRLVPDLALAIPQDTHGNRSFTFTLRRVSYSTGRLVEASDFVRATERLFRVRSPDASLFDRIVGARACEAHSGHCRLSSGVIADDSTRTVTFRLAAPDPDFLYKLAVGVVVPVPPGTPMHDISTHPIPGTGPYRFATIDRHRIVFVRNLHFHEWSHFAQPNGEPDRIEWRFGATPQREVDTVARGHADWTGDLVAGVESVVRRNAVHVHSNVFPTLFWLQINTHDPPFTDVHVRQALNYAMDRSAVARAYGGSLANTPSCQTIPPGEPGYHRYCPYTLERGPAGRWTAPDMRSARELVVHSGTRGARVTVWDVSDTGIAEPVIPYLAQLLRRLGYRPRVRVLSTRQWLQTTSAQRAKVDLMPVIFGPDYPSPAEAYSLFLACGGADNWRQFCDPNLDAEARQAEAAGVTDPTRSEALWARLDRQLVDRAVWVPLASQRIIDVVSRRLGNYEFSPVYHFLPAQATLR